MCYNIISYSPKEVTMIEFKGEFSNDCKLYMAKKALRLFAFVLFITIFIMLIPMVIVLIIGQEDSTLFFMAEVTVILLCILFLAGIVLIVCSFIHKIVAATAKKYNTKNLPNRVIIDDKMIEKDGEVINEYALISKVKKVIDEGEWYFILFYFPYKQANCICQKNLITKGSIEEFEELFKDKIIRRKGGKYANK